MLNKIQELLAEVENLTAKNLDEIEALRVKYLAKKGELNALMGEFRNVA
ncbi:MAG: phenylalanine--tRNA ligase subunit alpha, partial [Prevotella sp.]|nr:phenylalanine--tRNA ligase subunit alpha [Prevotella sp.]